MATDNCRVQPQVDRDAGGRAKAERFQPLVQAADGAHGLLLLPACECSVSGEAGNAAPASAIDQEPPRGPNRP
jgi:hypothetical protein